MAEQVELAQIKKGLEMILDMGDLKERAMWVSSVVFRAYEDKSNLMNWAISEFYKLPDGPKNDIYKELETSETMIRNYAKILGLNWTI